MADFLQADFLQPVCLQDFEVFARNSLSSLVYEYYRSGCYPEQTLADNVKAFQRYRLRPKLLRDVSRRDLRTTVLGQEIAFPIAVAPTAMQRMAHSDGEVATARAVASLRTGVVLSSVTTSTMEEVAEASSPRGLRWAQMYIFKDEQLVRDIVMKAETNGYGALFVTVDSPIGRRPAGESLQLPPHLRLAHFGGEKLSSGLTVVDNPEVTWSHIDWLKSITTLPIVLKGVLTGEFAREARDHQIAGIVVSNHGGRSLDGDQATIDALSEVVEAVRGSNIEVYLDGGVRKGTDVLKALALGARAVFIGRPIIWGLAYDGEAGVRKVLEIIRDEFSLAMALSGCSCIKEITADLVMKGQLAKL